MITYPRNFEACRSCGYQFSPDHRHDVMDAVDGLCSHGQVRPSCASAFYEWSNHQRHAQWVELWKHEPSGWGGQPWRKPEWSVLIDDWLANT